MKIILLFVAICFFAIRPLQAQLPDTSSITLAIENKPIQEVFEKLSQISNIPFSYQSNLESLQKRISINVVKQSFAVLMNIILKNSNLSYKIYAGQMVIFPFITNIYQKILIEGKLCRTETKEPITFAGIELKAAHKGTVADMQGYFRMEIDRRNINDTLEVSSLSFHSIKIPISHLTYPGMHTFFMNQKTYNLPLVEVKSEKQKLEQWGNHRWFSSGSFYLDTHGQQTALLIKNENHQSGNLISVSFYLSKKGNTDAPFRVHIYSNDSITGKPGTEMLPEMVIIKQNNGKGWYKINLSRYRIILPSTGLYVAIEGIFPGDYDFSYNDKSQMPVPIEESTDDFEGETISYGQQIGYSGGSENNTWHYSMDQTWFQLKKKHFNVMISSEFKIIKTQHKQGFLGLFSRRKKEQL